MDRLYTMLFEARIKADLDTLGRSAVYDHLQKIQSRRNEFIHGNAEAIDDDLVRETVERLPDVQAAWASKRETFPAVGFTRAGAPFNAAFPYPEVAVAASTLPHRRRYGRATEPIGGHTPARVAVRC